MKEVPSVLSLLCYWAWVYKLGFITDCFRIYETFIMNQAKAML